MCGLCEGWNLNENREPIFAIIGLLLVCFRTTGKPYESGPRSNVLNDCDPRACGRARLCRLVLVLRAETVLCAPLWSPLSVTIHSFVASLLTILLLSFVVHPSCIVVHRKFTMLVRTVVLLAVVALGQSVSLERELGYDSPCPW